MPAAAPFARAADALTQPTPRGIVLGALAVAAVSLLAAYSGTLGALGSPSAALPNGGAYGHLASRLDPLPGVPTLRRALEAVGRAVGWRLATTSSEGHEGAAHAAASTAARRSLQQGQQLHSARRSERAASRTACWRAGTVGQAGLAGLAGRPG